MDSKDLREWEIEALSAVDYNMDISIHRHVAFGLIALGLVEEVTTLQLTEEGKRIVEEYYKPTERQTVQNDPELHELYDVWHKRNK